MLDAREVVLNMRYELAMAYDLTRYAFYKTAREEISHLRGELEHWEGRALAAEKAHEADAKAFLAAVARAEAAEAKVEALTDELLEARNR